DRRQRLRQSIEGGSCDRRPRNGRLARAAVSRPVRPAFSRCMHAYAAPPDSEPALDLAFEHLYRRYVKDVYRYTLAVLRNPSDAEDVTQTTFLNAYRAFQRGEQPRKPQHWLIKIAHNAC